MLTTSLLSRSLAQTSPRDLARAQNSRLIHALQPAPRVRFEGEASGRAEAVGDGTGEPDDSNDDEAGVRTVFAHRAGVNAITVDKFEGR